MAPLIWKDVGVVDERLPAHREYEAQTAIFDYLVTPNVGLGDGKFLGYLVQTSGGRILGKDITSLEDAKALAQKDYDRT
jgi:hypothetical protein